MLERRRIWTDDLLAGYIRDELGFPGARQGAMVEEDRVDIATGEVGRERWYLLTSLSSRRCGPKALPRVFRQHWSVENSLNHGKDRSWDEDLHTLRRPGLGVGIRHPGEHRDQCPAPVRMASTRMSMPLRANSCAFRPIQTITSLYRRATWLCNHPGGRGRDF